MQDVGTTDLCDVSPVDCTEGKRAGSLFPLDFSGLNIIQIKRKAYHTYSIEMPAHSSNSQFSLKVLPGQQLLTQPSRIKILTWLSVS